MNFTYDGADLSKIIKSYRHNDNSYTIEYLDGSITNYISNSEEEIDKLEKMLLEQVLDRKENMKIIELQLQRLLLYIILLLSCYLMVIASSKKNNVIFLLTLFLSIYEVSDMSKKKSMVHELKKYRLFVEIMDEIKEFDESELLKSVEFENIRQIPLSLNTLDEYSYSDIKNIKRQIPKLKRKKMDV